jgi:hypothetical protein
MVLSNADMRTVAGGWQVLFSEPVTISERVRMKTVDVRITASSQEEFRKKFVAALQANGIYAVKRFNGTILDSEPETEAKK